MFAIMWGILYKYSIATYFKRSTYIAIISISGNEKKLVDKMVLYVNKYIPDIFL